MMIGVRGVQSTVGSATSWLVTLGAIRQLAEQAREVKRKRGESLTILGQRNYWRTGKGGSREQT